MRPHFWWQMVLTFLFIIATLMAIIGESNRPHWIWVVFIAVCVFLAGSFLNIVHALSTKPDRINDPPMPAA